MQDMKMHWALFFTLVLKTIAAPTSHEKRQHIIDEAKDIKNTWGESRPAQNTDTIDYEVPGDCEKLEERCTEINEPVCGTDGLTHRNKCKLKLSSCYKPEDNVTIAHEGECVRENDSDGCWYHVLNKVLPYGTKGYEKCLQKECQQDKSWHPTGERLLNCDVGSVKCWNWVTNETAPLESTMDFECNQYLCTVEDWELNGERKSCEGCLSVTSNEYLPHGFDGYWKCEQFECLRNNSWQETGERLPGCSVGEVKCWDWNLDATVPLDSEMLHNNIKFICTEDDWQQISIHDSSSPAVGSMACFNWQTKESVPIKSTMYFECNHYLCTEENEWVIKGDRNISCETEGCLSMITNEVEPYDTKGYYKCEQFECLRNNTWHNTGVKLSSCSSVEMKCLHWYNNEIVPIGSVMFHNCNQYICSDNDWKKTANIDPSCIAVGSMACFNLLTKESVHIGSTIYFECNHYVCTEENEWVIKGDRNISCVHLFSETEGCWSMITNEVEPYETKGYFKCEQFECLRNNTWHNTGEKLAGCSGTVTCWNVITKESLPVNSTAYFECYQYICTEQDDWKQTWKRDPACGETNGCWTKVTQEEVPYGYKGYYDCEQFECTENWDWKKTGERLSGCSVGKFKCWDWHQDAAVPVNSVFIHKNIQYTCTEKDWEKKTIQDPSSLETGGCLSMFTKEVVPYDHKGYYLCEQFECLRNKTWHKTGEKLSACSNGEVKCWNWNLGAAVPINSALFHNNNQYECTEEDWTPLPELAVDEPALIPEYRFDAGIECVPGVTSEHDGQQCCCSDEAILDCNGPCPDSQVTASPRISLCTPGQNITNDYGQACCCISENELDCTGPCLEQELTTMSKMDEPELTTMSKMEEPELTTMSEMEEPELTTMSEMEEPELTTMSEMETTTKDSSSSKKEISLLLFLLSAALFWI